MEGRIQGDIFAHDSSQFLRYEYIYSIFAEFYGKFHLVN